MDNITISSGSKLRPNTAAAPNGFISPTSPNMQSTIISSCSGDEDLVRQSSNDQNTFFSKKVTTTSARAPDQIK